MKLRDLIVVILSCASLSGVTLACGRGPVDVTVPENGTARIERWGVGVLTVTRKMQFRSGKRVPVLQAAVLVRDGSLIDRQLLSVGDELTLGAERWSVIDVVAGTTSTLGFVVLRRQD